MSTASVNRSDFESLMLERPDVPSKSALKRNQMRPDEYQYGSLQMAWETYQAAINRSQAQRIELMQDLAAVRDMAKRQDQEIRNQDRQIANLETELQKMKQRLTLVAHLDAGDFALLDPEQIMDLDMETTV